jgi:hypothetical protein
MGYELGEVKKIRIVNKETGEEIYSKEIGDWNTSMPYTVEDQTVEQPKITFPKNSELHFSTTLVTPPKPNVMFIISPGWDDGEHATKFAFYRPKYYNWFQRFMYKLCFGIKIIQGDEVKREFF